MKQTLIYILSTKRIVRFLHSMQMTDQQVEAAIIKKIKINPNQWQYLYINQTHKLNAS